MNTHEIINNVTREVMYILKTEQDSGSQLLAGTEINVSGKTVIFLLPNVDVPLESFVPLLKEFKKKNQVKAFFPKWGRAVSSGVDLRETGIEINYIDYTNAANAKLISGDIFIVPVNNDNVLRKLGKLERSNAYLAALVQALAMNNTVYLVPGGDYQASANLVADVTKTRAKVGNIIDIQKNFLSVAAKPTPEYSAGPAKTSLPVYQAAAPSGGDSSESNCFTCTTHDCITRCLTKIDPILKAGADRVAATLGNKDIPVNIASFIDHTLLKPEATEAQVIQLCDEARKYTFASVCINPHYVALCARLLKGTPVKVCTVIGFPLGATTTETKAYETKKAITDGADEIDMVINVGALKSKDYGKVEEDIRAVVQACGGKTLKVILETALLNNEEKVKGCELSVKAGANFVKTSTGFGPGGATEEDIALMRHVVGPDLGVKASGGIRDTMTTLKMLRAGATRVGASASVAIVNNDAPVAQDKNSKY